MTIHDTIAQRHNVHGDFADNARIAQALRTLFRNEPGWDKLSDIQKESLDMDITKISRILSGDSNHKDHWHDKAGYATLAEQSILPIRLPTSRTIEEIALKAVQDVVS